VSCRPRAREAREDLGALPLVRYAHLELLPRFWALRATITAYDAAYVALAEALRCRLLTYDAKLARAAGPHGPATLLQ
jgi:predicted nucleic acid-binding protein